MLKKLYLIGLGLILPLIPMPLFAWGVTGHRIVAEIAYRHLTPKAQKAVAAILGRESMAMVSTWPDFIKSDTTHTYDHRYSWHFVDFPAHSDKAAMAATLQTLTNKENLYDETNALIAELKSGKGTKQEKWLAMSYLIHMIGDMHQPLHVGRDEDQGGNKIPVMWFNQQSNLHRVWDEQLIDFQQLSYTEYTAALDTADAGQIRVMQHGDIKDWLYESNQIAERIYEKTAANEKLSYKYNYIFVKELNSQLLKGGLRLAAILNEIYK
jgi:hypothetical protein